MISKCSAPSPRSVADAECLPNQQTQTTQQNTTQQTTQPDTRRTQKFSQATATPSYVYAESERDVPIETDTDTVSVDANTDEHATLNLAHVICNKYRKEAIGSAVSFVCALVVVILMCFIIDATRLANLNLEIDSRRKAPKQYDYSDDQYMPITAYCDQLSIKQMKEMSRKAGFTPVLHGQYHVHGYRRHYGDRCGKIKIKYDLGWMWTNRFCSNLQCSTFQGGRAELLVSMQFIKDLAPWAPRLANKTCSYVTPANYKLSDHSFNCTQINQCFQYTKNRERMIECLVPHSVKEYHFCYYQYIYEQSSPQVSGCQPNVNCQTNPLQACVHQCYPPNNAHSVELIACSNVNMNYKLSTLIIPLNQQYNPVNGTPTPDHYLDVMAKWTWNCHDMHTQTCDRYNQSKPSKYIYK